MIHHRAPALTFAEAPVAARTVPTWVLWSTGAAAWAVAGGYDLRYGRGWFLDLRVYLAAGHALYAGQPFYSLLYTGARLPFSYPPFALFVLSPLSLLPTGVAIVLWWLASAAALVATVTIALRCATSLQGRRAVAAASVIAGLSVGLEPVRSSMNYGQVNWFLMLLVLWDLTRSTSRRRGVALGIAAAVKLTPLVFVLVYALDRDWRSLARTAGTFAALTLGSWAILPSASTQYWFHLAFDAGRDGNVDYVGNQSWDGLLHRAPFAHLTSSAALWAVLALATVIAVAALGGRLLAAGRRLQAVLVVSLCELLISPISWTHHWSWLAVAPVVLPDLWRRRPAAAVMVGVLLAVALAAPYWWSAGGAADLTGDSLVLAGAATICVWLAVEHRAGIAGAGTVAT
jgi:alpha-1,2-mannosyltransferase